MSGLFDDIAGRFGANAVVQIRPRPQARFEGEAGGDLEEQGAVAVAPAPTGAPAPPVAERRPPAHAQVAQVARTTPAHAGQDQPEPRQNDRPNDPPAGPTGSVTTKTQDAPASEQRPQFETPAPLPPADLEPAQTRAPVPDDTTAAAPAKDRPPAQPGAQPDEATQAAAANAPAAPDGTVVSERPAPHPEASEPETQTEPPQEPQVIRIGHIEVRQPAKPQPPAPPPAPARQLTPPARHASATPRAANTRLTDYLGWKK